MRMSGHHIYSVICEGRSGGRTTERQLGFGHPPLAIYCGQSLGLQPGSKPRSGHRVDEPVPNFRQLSHYFAIPAGGESSHRLLHERVWAVEREVHGGDQYHGPRAVVRCHHASARLAIFFASPTPPHHERSSITTSTASASRNSRNARRVAIVSLAQIGTPVRARKLASMSALVILIGSSTQNGWNGAKARSTRSAASGVQSECSSAMMSIL